MCGRYEAGLNQMELEEYRRAIQELDQLVLPDQPIREAFPSQQLPIITRHGFEAAAWGYPLDKKLVINARSESITERKMFAGAIQHQRCLVPAQAYYEWKQSKVKYRIGSEKLMTLAGLLLNSPQGLRFVIITAAANEQLVSIHHRMPVLLDPDQLSDYLFDTSAALQMLKPYSEQLLVEAQSPEQLSLFDYSKA